jgi:ubiquinone biosynthesis protein UbiJ
MKWPDAGEAPARLANRILSDQDWARARLAPFAGRTFSLAVGLLNAQWQVTEGGALLSMPASAPVDLRLALSPLSVPSFLADPRRWNEFVREEGDADFGGALKDLACTLPWFVEEAFAKAMGPVVGQQLADVGRKLLAFPEYAAQRVTDSAASYARDEAGLLMRGGDLTRLRKEIEETAARVDALAHRIDALAPRVRPIR